MASKEYRFDSRQHEAKEDFIQRSHQQIFFFFFFSVLCAGIFCNVKVFSTIGQHLTLQKEMPFP